VSEYQYSLKPLREMYGMTPADQFSPVALKAVRQRMVETGWSRGVVNARVARTKRAFRWCVSEGLVPVAVLQALETVDGLARGRTPARETEPIKPVPSAFVDAIRPHVRRQVWAMVDLQRLTGMRPGEVILMRACDLDTSGEVWMYRPQRHKLSYRGSDRTVALGPRAQHIVREFLRPQTEAFLFSPADAERERLAAMRARRMSKVQPSQVCRKKRRPKKRRANATRRRATRGRSPTGASAPAFRCGHPTD
jgi:integrase